MSSLRRCAIVLRSHYKGATLRSKVMKLAFPCTVYVIWKTRNVVCFDGAALNIVDLIVKIKLLVFKLLAKIYPPHIVKGLMF